MKDLVYGEEFEFKGMTLKFKVRGILPAGQPLQLNFSGEKIYNVEVNGRCEYMKESFLDMLNVSQVKADIGIGIGKPTELIGEKTENLIKALPKILGRPPKKRRGK